MSKLTHALNRIVSWLEKHPSEKYASVDVLQPGLNYEEIERRVADLPFKLPEEVYELYQWRNGTCDVEEERAQFFNSLTFLSLEAALDKYYELLEEAQELAEESSYDDDEDYIYDNPEDYWDEMWFSLFSSMFIDERCFYLVEGDIEGKINPTIFYSDEYIIFKEFNNLTNMMLTIAECYETGAFYFDDYGYLTNSYYKQESIGQKYNPGTINF